MAATLAITPASGSIEATVDACRIDLTGGYEPNDDVTPGTVESGWNASDQSGIATFTIRAVKSGFGETLRSVVFTPNASGEFTWFNLIFPEAGTWTVSLRDSSDVLVGSASISVVVS